MKIVAKVVAVLAIIIGAMAVVVGTRVLLGVFDPGYPYFLLLVSYNVIMGAVSVITGILILKQSKKSIPYSIIIASLHIIVLILLLTIFNDVISEHSIKAMTVRSIAWIIFSIIIWQVIPKLQTSRDFRKTQN